MLETNFFHQISLPSIKLLHKILILIFQFFQAGESRNVTAVDTLLDLARNLCPPNLIQATIQQYRTVLTYPGDGKKMEGGVERDGSNLYTWKISGEFTNGTNILGLVFFAGKHSQKSIVFHVLFFKYTKIFLIV